MWRIFEFAWGSRDSPENASVYALMQPLAIEDGDMGGDGEESEIPSLEAVPTEEPEAEFEECDDIEFDGESIATTQPEQSPDDNLPSSEIPEMTRAEYRKWAQENPNMAQKNMDGTQPEPPYSPAYYPAVPCPEAPPSDPSAMPPPAPPSPGATQRKKEIEARLVELRWGRSKKKRNHGNIKRKGNR